MDSASDESLADDTSARATAIPDAPALRDPLVGTLLVERYELEGLLGVGATMRTYRALDRTEQRTVVVKLLHEPLRANEKVQRRIARDVASGRQLDHPHIARVLEHGSDTREGPFVVRELVAGEPLTVAARREALTPRRLCELMTQLSSALSEAHRHGVLHRNLKPQNVLVCRDDGRETVRVCDFGHAGAARLEPAYRAPEQLRADGNVDGQADVYAVGVLMYELLCDELPYRGASAEELLKQLSEPLVPPSKRRADRPIPRELEAVCLKALAVDPNERPHSPRELSQALRAAVALLHGYADEPLGSGVFVADGRAVAPTASSERLTMPGEQLRSRTKLGLGAALVAAVCAGVLLIPESQRQAERALPPFVTGNAEEVVAGERALEEGVAELRAGDAKRALVALRRAREALGDSPAVLRALGEALVVEGHTREGVPLLERYLEVEPNATDRPFVESLIRREPN